MEDCFLITWVIRKFLLFFRTIPKIIFKLEFEH